jgi:predicted 3-demethylubiquinone-9 3-methyltransferase (glyoxalase superfamily)
MQKIVTYLWFDGQAEQAAKLYTSLFDNSRITHVQRYGDAGPGPAGTAMIVAFELAGQEFFALNGGPQYKFTEAVSLFVKCKDQKEVDKLWDSLTEGGEEQPCGWLKDRFGLSWQIIPNALTELMSDPDPEKAGRVVQAMLQMSKIDVAGLERAHAGR